MKLLGAVLAGGESRRFGSDKLAALLDRVTLLDHAITWLKQHTDAIVICGRGVAAYPTLTDLPEPGLGPLGGLAAALQYGAAHGYDVVLSIPGDTPELPAGLFEQLLAIGAPVFVRGCPVIGLWPTAAAPLLIEQLRGAEDRSMRGWARAIEAAPLTLEQAIPNVNFPADLEALQHGG